MKIRVKIINNILYPDERSKLLLKKYKENDIILYEVKNKRSYNQLKLYWILLRSLSFHFQTVTMFNGDEIKGITPVQWHEYFKRIFLGIDTIINPITLQTVEINKSICFEKMSQDEFNEYFSSVQQWLYEIGYSWTEIIDTAPYKF